ncbi:hypothetical protein IAD21_05358 [Abditibacteriota bacterium]|nr:hypothetical protein IAD21_05358 [Abditibacteriota bacterium]
MCSPFSFFEIMKRRVWLGLLGVPVLLAGSILWLRHLEWIRLENKVRQDIEKRATGKEWGRPEGLRLLIEEQYLNNRGPIQCFPIHPDQTNAIISKLHLANNSMKDARDNGDVGNFSRSKVIISRQYYRARNIDLVIYLSWPSHIIFSPPDSREADWSGLQLTPESCHSINHYIWTQYGAKLRALHIPPPQ